MTYLIDPEITQNTDEFIAVVVREEAVPRRTVEHSHVRGQLIGSLRGLVTIFTPAGHWVVPAFHAAWIPPEVPHGLTSHGPYAGWSAYIPKARCIGLSSDPLTLRVSGLLREAILRASAWAPATQLNPSQMRVGDIIVDEIRSCRKEPLELQTPQDRRLHKVAQEILRNPAGNRDLHARAALAGTSTRTLTRQFRAETGLSLSEWKQKARLLRALEMLATGEAVSSIAYELGYETPSAFIATFRRALATSPGKFMAAQQNKERLADARTYGQE